MGTRRAVIERWGGMGFLTFLSGGLFERAKEVG